MSVNLGYDGWLFVVDTDSYSGNFERQMCAFMTGHAGECGVGDDIAEAANEEMTEALRDAFDEKISQVPDEHGCCRPVTIYSTPGFFNNGLGGNYPDDGKHEQEALDHHRAACKEEANKSPYTDEDANTRHREEWERDAQKHLKKYPACQSVAIFFDERPSDDEITWMIKRARKFACGDWEGRLREFSSPFKILGFRLLKLKTLERLMVQWQG